MTTHPHHAADLRKALKPYTRKAKPTGLELGSGAYGTVIELRSAGEIVAGKVFKTLSTIDHQVTNKLYGELILLAQVDHPNIVQCKGVCFLENQTMPVLLMERLMSSLHAYLLDPIRSNLALDRKVSILHDVASGLVYLHSRIPAIIHRDLTAKNVLLNSELRAKIADFGNARIMDLDPETTPETFTSLPGTQDYMPPEAEGASTKYDPSLDVFSFGHLSLFTIIQSPVHPLLPSTYTDDEGLLHARSEVKRREQYLEKAEELLGVEHSLVVLVKQCLHNYPARRPQTAELVTRLQDTPDTLDGTSHSQPDTILYNQPAGQQLSVNDLHTVMEELNNVRAKWYDIGVQLRVNIGTLDAIKEQYLNNPSDCLRETLTTWLKSYPPHSTWSKVVDALKSSTVGEARLAADLEQKYCSPRPVLPTPIPPQMTTSQLSVPMVSGTTQFPQYPVLSPVQATIKEAQPVTQHYQDHPTVLECIRFQGLERTINIPQEIGMNCSQFGILLLNDPNGTRVYNIERDYREIEQINTEILREWVTGRGKNPVSWETLIIVLHDIELHILASEIEEVKLKTIL